MGGTKYDNSNSLQKYPLPSAGGEKPQFAYLTVIIHIISFQILPNQRLTAPEIADSEHILGYFPSLMGCLSGPIWPILAPCRYA
jgi:hypothetical protein